MKKKKFIEEKTVDYPFKFSKPSFAKKENLEALPTDKIIYILKSNSHLIAFKRLTNI